MRIIIFLMLIVSTYYFIVLNFSKNLGKKMQFLGGCMHWLLIERLNSNKAGWNEEFFGNKYFEVVDQLVLREGVRNLILGYPTLIHKIFEKGDGPFKSLHNEIGGNPFFTFVAFIFKGQKYYFGYSGSFLSKLFEFCEWPKNWFQFRPV